MSTENADSAVPQVAQSLDFGNIALSLSGGGYRAAAFHLGTLDILHRVGLLEQTTMLSTVSGGTITGAAYASALARGESFDAFFARLSRFLIETNLPELWLGELARQRKESPGKSPSLIVAAANAYDRGIFEGERFAFLLERPTHLKEIVFNATELRSGLGFRFQKSASGGIAGNGNYRLPRQLLHEIRLADAVAASSCFPGGFEPLLFPNDFEWPTASNWQASLTRLEATERARAAATFVTPLALVDGGVYDNQGIEALLLADERVRRQTGAGAIGTLIISDTDNIQPGRSLIGELKSYSSGSLTLGGLATIARSVQLLLVGISAVLSASALGALFSGRSGGWEVLVFIAAVAAVALSAAYAWANGKAHQLGPYLLETLALDVPADFWNRAARLTIGETANLVNSRALAISALGPTFLKRTRSLIYKKVYGERAYLGRRISNLIYEFQPEAKAEAEADTQTLPVDGAPGPAPTAALKPTEQMQQLSQQATATPTTLWFDSSTAAAQVDLLVACGQFTTCYNLLRFIADAESDIGLTQSPVVQAVHAKAQELWEALKENPQGLK